MTWSQRAKPLVSPGATIPFVIRRFGLPAARNETAWSAFRPDEPLGRAHGGTAIRAAWEGDLLRCGKTRKKLRKGAGKPMKSSARVTLCAAAKSRAEQDCVTRVNEFLLRSRNPGGAAVRSPVRHRETKSHVRLGIR